MEKKKTSLLRRSFVSSLLALLLCVAMLVGTTYAWFTDSVTSGTNRIVAGDLDIEVSYEKSGNWVSIAGEDSLFDKTALWEPGHTEFVTLKIENKGTLAFDYTLNVTPVSESGGINVAGEEFKLSDYLVFGTTAASETAPTAYTKNAAGRVAARSAVGTTQKLTQANLTKSGSILKDGAAQYVTMVVYMPEDVDNEANYKTGTEAPYIELGITVYATQKQYESDSFGSDYDGEADLSPDNTGADKISYEYTAKDVVKTSVTSDGDTVFNSVVTISQEDGTNTKVTIPKGTAGFTEDSFATLKITATPILTANNKFTLTSGEGSVGAIDLTAVVTTGDIENTVSEFKDGNDNPVTVLVDTYTAKGLTNVSVSYKNGDTTESWTKVDNKADVNAAHEFWYDSENGELVFGTNHFSNFLLGADEAVYDKNTNMAYKTVAAALNACGNVASEFVLLKDVDITGSGLTIVEAQNITLDLNGHSIGANYKAFTAAFYCITNNGTLTIKDSTDSSCNGSGSGKIYLYAESGDTRPVPGYATDVVFNQGTLTIESGLLENNCPSTCSCSVDNLNQGKLTMNGGRLSSVVYSVRQYDQSCSKENTVTITGGVLEQQNGGTAFWLQDGDMTNGAGTTTIKNVLIKGTVLIGYGNYSKDFNVLIDNNTITGDVIICSSGYTSCVISNNTISGNFIEYGENYCTATGNTYSEHIVGVYKVYLHTDESGYTKYIGSNIPSGQDFVYEFPFSLENKTVNVANGYYSKYSSAEYYGNNMNENEDYTISGNTITVKASSVNMGENYRFVTIYVYDKA